MTDPKAPGDGSRVGVWLELRAPLESPLAPQGEAVMAALQVAPGERGLYIGCGVGGTPRALARAVGPDGSVVGFDLLADAVAAAEADADRPANLIFLCGDAQTYPFEPGTFDVVFSRFGLMFFADAVAAFSNIRRAMRRGGRLGFVCWRGLE